MKRARLKRKVSKPRPVRLSRRDLTEMSTTKLYDLTGRFFRKRFGREPRDDEGYFMEWAQRFRSGFPERFMDLESQRVFRSLFKIVA